jgi:hypothetical protein
MSSIQSLTNHLQTLEERHRALDKLITEEYNNFVRDDQVETHKKEKLLLKDEMETIKKKIEEMTIGNQ